MQLFIKTLSSSCSFEEIIRLQQRLKLKSSKGVCKYFNVITTMNNKQNSTTFTSHHHLRWFGHLIRMQENRAATKALRLKSEQKRRCRRLRTTWKDAVMRDVQHMDISWEDKVDKATKRNEWRSWIALCTLHATN